MKTKSKLYGPETGAPAGGAAPVATDAPAAAPARPPRPVAPNVSINDIVSKVMKDLNAPSGVDVSNAPDVLISDAPAPTATPAVTPSQTVTPTATTTEVKAEVPAAAAPQYTDEELFALLAAADPAPAKPSAPSVPDHVVQFAETLRAKDPGGYEALMQGGLEGFAKYADSKLQASRPVPTPAAPVVPPTPQVDPVEARFRELVETEFERTARSQDLFKFGHPSAGFDAVVKGALSGKPVVLPIPDNATPEQKASIARYNAAVEDNVRRTMTDIQIRVNQRLLAEMAQSPEKFRPAQKAPEAPKESGNEWALDLVKMIDNVVEKNPAFKALIDDKAEQEIGARYLAAQKANPTRNPAELRREVLGSFLREKTVKKEVQPTQPVLNGVDSKNLAPASGVPRAIPPGGSTAPTAGLVAAEKVRAFQSEAEKNAAFNKVANSVLDGLKQRGLISG